MFFIASGKLQRVASVLGLSVTIVTGAAAQQQPVTTLTLDEALELARRNSPSYLMQANDLGPADWAVREAYGALLPGADASIGFGWQDAGQSRFGIFTGDDIGLATTTGYYSSSYSLGLSYRLSGASLMSPGRERARRDATRAGIDAAGTTLDADVTRLYLAVKRAQDGVTLAEQELTRTNENKTLADARVSVGAAVPLEASQAELEVGRAEVALLQARNLVETERLRLLQLIGLPSVGEVTLTTNFGLTDVPWVREDLVAYALDSHPQLVAARADVQVADASVRIARSAYLPSLSLSASLLSGFSREATNGDFLIRQAEDQVAGQISQCQFLNDVVSRLTSPLPGYPVDCSGLMLTDEQRSAILARNNTFPFDYSRDPVSLSLSVSVPIFQGLSRERQVEEARAAASDAAQRIRAEELRIRTDVETAYLNTMTAHRSVELEERNQQLADEQLRIARERYRLGATSFVELIDAETAKAQADRAYLNAIYAFHENLAALEAAVGVRLRAPGGSN